MLDALSYERPRVPVQRASTDGDASAAHRAPPRPVPVGVDTPAPEPPPSSSRRSPKPVTVAVGVTTPVNPREAETVPRRMPGAPMEPRAPAAVTTVIIARKR